MGYEEIYGIPVTAPGSGIDEEEYLKQLAHSYVLTPLSYLGETLDKPGRAVRGLLGGQGLEALANLIPFSDTMGVTDPADTVTGRDLLRKAGVAGPEDNWGNWLGGLGAEILLDPLNAMTLGTKSTLTALGRDAAKSSAGLAKTAAGRVAAEQSGLVGLRTPFWAEMAGVAPQRLPLLTKGRGAEQVLGSPAYLRNLLEAVPGGKAVTGTGDWLGAKARSAFQYGAGYGGDPRYTHIMGDTVASTEDALLDATLQDRINLIGTQRSVDELLAPHGIDPQGAANTFYSSVAAARENVPFNYKSPFGLQPYDVPNLDEATKAAQFEQLTRQGSEQLGKIVNTMREEAIKRGRDVGKATSLWDELRQYMPRQGQEFSVGIKGQQQSRLDFLDPITPGGVNQLEEIVRNNPAIGILSKPKPADIPLGQWQDMQKKAMRSLKKTLYNQALEQRDIRFPAQQVQEVKRVPAPAQAIPPSVSPPVTPPAAPIVQAAAELPGKPLATADDLLAELATIPPAAAAPPVVTAIAANPAESFVKAYQDVASSQFDDLFEAAKGIKSLSVNELKEVAAKVNYHITGKTREEMANELLRLPLQRQGAMKRAEMALPGAAPSTKSRHNIDDYLSKPSVSAEKAALLKQAEELEIFGMKNKSEAEIEAAIRSKYDQLAPPAVSTDPLDDLVSSLTAASKDDLKATIKAMDGYELESLAEKLDLYGMEGKKSAVVKRAVYDKINDMRESLPMATGDAAVPKVAGKLTPDQQMILDLTKEQIKDQQSFLGDNADKLLKEFLEDRGIDPNSQEELTKLLSDKNYRAKWQPRMDVTGQAKEVKQFSDGAEGLIESPTFNAEHADMLDKLTTYLSDKGIDVSTNKDLRRLLADPNPKKLTEYLAKHGIDLNTLEEVVTQETPIPSTQAIEPAALPPEPVLPPPEVIRPQEPVPTLPTANTVVPEVTPPTLPTTPTQDYIEELVTKMVATHPEGLSDKALKTAAKKATSYLARLNPEVATEGLYRGDVVGLVDKYAHNLAKQAAPAEGVLESLATVAQKQKEVLNAGKNPRDFVSLDKVLRSAGLTGRELKYVPGPLEQTIEALGISAEGLPRTGYNEIAESGGKTLIDKLASMGKAPWMSEYKPNQVRKMLKNYVIPKDMAEKIAMEITGPGYEVKYGFGKGISDATDAIRSFFTQPWVPFHTRNIYEGHLQQALGGAFNPKTINETQQYLRGAMKDPALVKQYDQYIAEAYATGAAMRHQMAEQMGESVLKKEAKASTPYVRQTGGKITEQAKGYLEGFKPSVAAKRGESYLTLDPTKNVAVQQGQRLSSAIDNEIRLSHFVELRKQGYAPEVASKMVTESHIDYSRLTPQERALRQLIPFYSFSKGNINRLAGQMQDPGAITSLIRTGAIGGRDDSIPGYIGGSAIPIPGAEEGSQRYISGLSMPFDDELLGSLVSLMSGSPIEAGKRAASAANPIAKLAATMATGRQLYSGRSLDDQTPSAITSLGGLIPQRPANILSEAIGATPFGRLASTANAVIGGRDQAMLLKLLTGIKTTDVDTQLAQQYAAQDAAKQALRRTGMVNAIEQLYPKAPYRDKETQPEELTRLLALLDELQKRGSALRKERQP